MRVRQIAVVVVLATVGMAAGPAHAARVPVSLGLPGLSEPLVERVGAELLAVDGLGAPRQPSAVLDALPGQIATTWGGQAVQADVDEAEDAGEDPQTGTFGDAWALPFDATGDGVDDVGGFSYDISTHAWQLFAWDGLTGGDVWQVPVDPEVWSYTVFVADDLTGDGIRDLVDLAFTEDRHDTTCTETETSWSCSYDEAFTWDVDVVSGATGQREMRRTQHGWYRGTESYDADGYRADIQARNLDPLPVPTDDHDGDGARDVVVHDTDISYQHVVDFDDGTEERSLVTDVTARVLGGDWTELATFSVTGVPGLPQLVPAGDLTGDATTDLVWMTDVEDGERTVEECAVELPVDPVGLIHLLGLCSTQTYSAWATQLQVVDGADFSTASTTTARDGDGRYWFSHLIADEDVTGDGVADLRLLTVASWFDEDTELLLLDGRTGAQVWSYATTDIVGPGYLADVDRDGDDDLVLQGTLTESIYDYSTGEGSTTVTFAHTVLDGPTGAVQAEHDISASRDYAANAFVLVLGLPAAVDVTGDGVPDPVMDSIFGTWDPETDEATYESVLRVLDGADPDRTVLDRDGAGPRFFADAADLDGTGSPVLLQHDLRDDWTATVTAVDPTTGEERWQVVDADGIGVLVGPDGTARILRTDLTQAQTHVSTDISLLDGRDLTPVWSRTLPAS